MAFPMQNTLVVATLFLIASLVLVPTNARICNGSQNTSGGFSTVRAGLLNDLINDAVARSNHVSKLTRTGYGNTIFGFAACDNGSSAYKCRNCLNGARADLNGCPQAVGAQTNHAGCTMRYEVYPF